jgi:hypothetical protein
MSPVDVKKPPQALAILQGLTVTEHLALLHSATVLACAFGVSSSNVFGSELGPIIILAVVGFLLLIFGVSKKEQQATSSVSITKKSTGSLKGGKVATTEDHFELAITDVRRNPATDKIEYRLDGAYNDERWSSWLRYSTLLQLKGRAGAKADSKFPRKTSATQWVSGAETGFAFVEERRRMLNQFLHEAVPTKEAFEILVQVPQVRRALGVPDSLEISAGGGGFKQEEAVKAGLKALDMTCDIATHANEGGDGWELYQRYPDGIACFLKKDGNFTFAMGKGPMDFSKEKACDFVLSLQHRKKWDDMFKFQDELELFVDKEKVGGYPPTQDPYNTGRSQDWEIRGLNVARSAFSSPAKAFVAERDSVCVGILATRRKDGAMCIALKSVEHPKAPEGLDGYVRAQIIVAGFLFEDRKDGKPGCVLTTMGLVDPNGSIPAFVINKVAPERALVIRYLNNAMKSLQ